jgi:hypothetical protein
VDVGRHLKGRITFHRIKLQIINQMHFPFSFYLTSKKEIKYTNVVKLNAPQIYTLLHGLSSLEGALKAIKQNPPEAIFELRKLLNQEANSLPKEDPNSLTTKQVAEILGRSTRTVIELGKSGAIKLISKGGRGRGFENTYEAASVRRFQRQHRLGKLA